MVDEPRRDEDGETEGIGEDDGAGLSLRVVHGELVASYALPLHGSVVVGRGREADVRIDDKSISRKHAVIHVGPPPCIEDCGSANGTKVGEERLAAGSRAPLRAGMVVQLGAVRAFLQRGSAPRRPRLSPGGPSELARLSPLIDKVAQSVISVLLCGETGVGKEVVASAVHARSPRATKPFVRLNCAALSEHLLESELFGHEKGAFTGAHQAKPGLLEIAAGGTVFLDEVGELPLAMQAKLLRVFEERAVMRVGALAPRPIDVRFIAATNRDLEAEVAGGRFRADLFFRLNGVMISIRPLRERTAEIPMLARQFVAEAARAAGRNPPAISPEALASLERREWPGNVRELRNVMERAVLLAGDVITLEQLPAARTQASLAPPPMPAAPAPAPATPAAPGRLRDEIASIERDRLLDALARCGGNQTQAAKMLGISRGTLMSRLEAYGVPRPRKRP